MYVDPKGLDRWGDDPSLQNIPLSDQEVCNWLSRAHASPGKDPYKYLFDVRNIHHLDRHDSNLVAAERYMGGYSGEYSDSLILGQHILKQTREIPGASYIVGKNGSPASSSSFVTKWGMTGNFHRENGSRLGGPNCGCEKN